MSMRLSVYEHVGRYLLRLGLASVFAYFGFFAVTDAAQQVAMWMHPRIADLIDIIIPVPVAVMIVGAIELVIACSLLSGVFMRYALMAACVLVVFILINTGVVGEQLVKEFVVLSALVYLLSQELGSRKKTTYV